MRYRTKMDQRSGRKPYEIDSDVLVFVVAIIQYI